MKRTYFTTNIIRSIFIFALLIFIFIKNEQLIWRSIIFAFLILLLCHIVENIYKLLNKENLAKLFHKLYIFIFIAFSCIFLIVWSYLCIKNEKYFLLIFPISIWLFVFYIIKRELLGIKTKKAKLKNSKFNFKFIISSFLVTSVLLIGIVCLIIGVKDKVNEYQIIKDYITTTAYFENYEIYNNGESLKHNKRKLHPTYRLIYTYKIKGKEYNLKTDYGSSSIPDINSTRKIKYNPNKPSEAVFIGTNGNNILIYFGAFFFLGGMVFVIAYLSIKGVFDKLRINILGLYIGIVFFIIGIGLIFLQLGATSSFIEVIKSMVFWVLIPIMFIVIGFFQIIKCIFFERLNMNTKKGKNNKIYFN